MRFSAVVIGFFLRYAVDVVVYWNTLPSLNIQSMRGGDQRKSYRMTLVVKDTNDFAMRLLCFVTLRDQMKSSQHEA